MKSNKYKKLDFIMRISQYWGITIREQHGIRTQELLQIESNLVNRPMTANYHLINPKGRLTNHLWSTNHQNRTQNELKKEGGN